MIPGLGGGTLGGGQGQGYQGGEPGAGGLIDSMHMVLILPDKWASGYIFASLSEAQAGLQAQRGSLPAGQTYKYEIWDREKAVEKGSVTSTQYIPDTTHFMYVVTESFTNTLIERSGETYDSQSACKSAALAVIAREKTKYPAQGTYYWEIYKAGQVVESGQVFWPKERGEWSGDGTTTPPGADGGDGGAPGKIPWGPLVLLVIVVGAGILFINWLTKGKAEVP